MSRRWFIALPLTAALLFGACGDSNNDDADGEADTESRQTVTHGDEEKPTVGLPTPTPVAEEGVAVTVVGGQVTYSPTVAEFRTLPQTEIDAGGTKRGVALEVLASQVERSESSIVTIQGLTADLNRIAYIRYPLSEIALNSVLVLDEQGHLNLYGSSLPEAEWLRVVIAISVN